MLSKDLDICVDKIKNDLHQNPDYVYKYINLKNNNLCLIYNDALCASDKIDNFVLKNLSFLKDEKIRKNLPDYLYNSIPNNNIKFIYTYEDIYEKLQTGFSIIIINKYSTALAVETKKNLTRSITESKVEKTVNGPKDAFVEDYLVNIGLIRRRIKSKDLIVEKKTLGKHTKTAVSIIYMNDIVEKKIIDEVKERLATISEKDIMDSSYIRSSLSKNKYSFPMIEMTERPDLTSMYLLEGKVCILVDTSPFALIFPTFFVDFFHSPEDYYQKPRNVSFTRIIRFIAFLVAILVPAFYIAITTYNHETIPLTLLVNFAAQRSGVPFPAFFEAILMIITFEILKESDIRLPNQMGSAISILGGIILGEAAVEAGIVSPIMVIVIAMTAIANLIFSHVDVVNAIRMWRIIFMIFASLLGIVGIYFCSFLFIVILSSYKSFGKPYLYPFAPINFKVLKDSLIRLKNNRGEKNPLLVNNEVKK